MKHNIKETVERLSSPQYYCWINKLSPFELDYKCDNDCEMSGCKGHKAKFEIYHATDTYKIVLGNREIHLDGTEMGLILYFAELASDDMKNMLRKSQIDMLDDLVERERKKIKIIGAIPEGAEINYARVEGYNEAKRETINYLLKRKEELNKMIK